MQHAVALCCVHSRTRTHTEEEGEKRGKQKLCLFRYVTKCNAMLATTVTSQVNGSSTRRNETKCKVETGSVHVSDFSFSSTMAAHLPQSFCLTRRVSSVLSFTRVHRGRKILSFHGSNKMAMKKKKKKMMMMMMMMNQPRPAVSASFCM